MSNESNRKRGSWETFKELGCGLLTIALVTLQVMAFSLATRGPSFFLKIAAILLIALVAVLVFQKARRSVITLLRRRNDLSRDLRQ